MEDHVLHLRKVLSILRKEQLFAKLSNCSFGQPKVEYLGHIISGEGVSTNPSKIEAMANWPTPKSVKDLKGFLGLTDYYRRFVKSYGVISRPLTNLLKKNGFHWDVDSEAAFQALKEAMTTAHVLALADFNKYFVVETDACSSRMGAILMQQGKLIAFFSKALAPRHMGLSTYEKEYMVVLSAVDKWRHYLQGDHFIIRTDHQSLKYLLEQRITTAL
ncbi:putative mitochondrial protein AtMg00860 [Nicotiana tabacum]|uniref:putative mitochondrial protein AtMg00860 n=1 Tax=Nicotiana tabacum TaxID=4097 RepID=UPI003F4ED5B0